MNVLRDMHVAQGPAENTGSYHKNTSFLKWLSPSILDRLCSCSATLRERFHFRIPCFLACLLPFHSVLLTLLFFELSQDEVSFIVKFFVLVHHRLGWRIPRRARAYLHVPGLFDRWTQSSSRSDNGLAV